MSVFVLLYSYTSSLEIGCAEVLETDVSICTFVLVRQVLVY
jgi:hypothetical protein